jgi:3-deoxy-D-manno-octulosonate 8-phosphate phosphatase (KDO 8-P phosphatase)
VKRNRTTAARPLPPKSLKRRLAAVALFLCDVDGVVTDASVYFGGGREFKRFDIQDGLGLVALRKCGIRVGWISSRPSAATSRRAADLKIDFLHQSKGGKVEAIEEILARAGLGWEQVCYAGDDLVDLGPLRRAGVAVAVANAVPEVLAVAHYITCASGGRGAVREIAEMILKAQNKWRQVVADHSK